MLPKPVGLPEAVKTRNGTCSTSAAVPPNATTQPALRLAPPKATLPHTHLVCSGRLGQHHQRLGTRGRALRRQVELQVREVAGVTEGALPLEVVPAQAVEDKARQSRSGCPVSAAGQAPKGDHATVMLKTAVQPIESPCKQAIAHPPAGRRIAAWLAAIAHVALPPALADPAHQSSHQYTLRHSACRAPTHVHAGGTAQYCRMARQPVRCTTQTRALTICRPSPPPEACCGPLTAAPAVPLVLLVPPAEQAAAGRRLPLPAGEACGW